MDRKLVGRRGSLIRWRVSYEHELARLCVTSLKWPDRRWSMRTVRFFNFKIYVWEAELARTHHLCRSTVLLGTRKAISTGKFILFHVQTSPLERKFHADYKTGLKNPIQYMYWKGLNFRI